MTSIIYRKGNILHTNCHFIAHGCNAQKKFNKGLAKQIRELYPDVYNSYMKADMRLGSHNPYYSENSKIVFFNCIIQKFYGNDRSVRYVDYNAIEDCIIKINAYIKNKLSNTISNGLYNLHDQVAMPKIGCGLAGGDWYIVSEIIEKNSIFFQPVVYEL